MNNYYTFIGTPTVAHFNTHLENQRRDINLRLQTQYWCHICYPPSDTTSEELNNFINWIQERGAISGSHITAYLFEDIIIADFLTLDRNELRQRIVRLLNTLVYIRSLTVQEQTYLVQILIDCFIDQEFKEESNPSEGHFSETTTIDLDIYSDEETIIDQQPPDWFDQEQLIIQTDTEEELSSQEESSEGELYVEPEEQLEVIDNNEAMAAANLNDILVGLNALTNALNVGLRTEKNHIPIRKFKGDDQDPVEWLRDFEVAATANGITDIRKIQIVRGYLEGAAAAWFDQRATDNALVLTTWSNVAHDEHDFKHRFVLKFRTPRKVEQWQNELETLQQTGSIDEYTNRFNALLKKVDPINAYPDDYKTRTYKRGLKPEIRKWVRINADGTLQNIINVAKTVEEANSEEPTLAYHQTQTKPTADLTQLTTVLQNLTSRLETLETPKRPAFQPRNNDWNYSRNNNYQPPICYNCNETGHLSRNCNKPYSPDSYRRNVTRNQQNWNNPNNRPNNNNNNSTRNNPPPVHPTSTNTNNNEQTNLLSQLQPLITALQALTPAQQNATANDTNSTLLATHDYLAGERKRAKVDDSEATIDEDIVMAGPSKPAVINILPPEIQPDEQPIPTARIIVPKKDTKKKSKAAQPVLAARSVPYDIVDDLTTTKANITIGQLIRTSPEQRLKMSKAMRRPTQTKRKATRKATGMVGQKIRTTSAWCEAKVGTVPIDLIIDTGASGCVASHDFLKRHGIKVQRKSNITMSDINGESKQPLGAIDNFPITIAGIVIPADVDITEARTYSIVVGMDWLNKIKAKLDLHTGTMTFEWNNQKGIVKIKFIYGQGYDSPDESSEDSDDESSSSDEDEIEEQHLESRNFLMFNHEEDWTTVQPRRRRVQPEDSVEIILEETWTPVDTHKREIIDIGEIPNQIIRSVKTINDVQAYQEGIKVQWRKFTWEDYKRLDEKFQQECRWNSRWSFDWRGPNKKCWCNHRLYTYDQKCRQCYDDLADWIAIEKHKPYRAEYKTSDDWAAEVEQELFVNNRIKESFDSYEEALHQIYPATQIEQCLECEKYVDKYYTGPYYQMNGEQSKACDACIRDKHLNLPACSLCGDRDEARNMYITGYYEKRYFCTYEHQCVFWFNRGGWRKNTGTIRKLRERSLLLDVYNECNEIGKAILSRYIQEEDIVNEIGYIEYEGSEEASATEIFHSIYQQISPERRLQLAKLEFINVKLCDNCLIPCDSTYCDDCVQPKQEVTHQPPMRIDKGKSPMYPIAEEEEPVEDTNQCVTTSEKLLEEIQNIKIGPLQTLDITNLQNTLNEIYQLCEETQSKIKQLETYLASDDESNYESCEEILEEYNPDDIMIIQDELEIRDANLAIKVYNDDDQDDQSEQTHEEDTRFNIKYSGEEPLTIRSQQTTLIDLYITTDIHTGTSCQLVPQLSLTQKGIDVKTGTIDSNYTGNVSVLLYNRSSEDYTIQPNDKIAQMVSSQQIPIEEFQPVRTRSELSESSHGINGPILANSEDMEAYFLSQEKDDQLVERRELTSVQEQTLNELLEEFNDIFAAELHELGRINKVQHIIDTGEE